MPDFFGSLDSRDCRPELLSPKRWAQPAGRGGRAHPEGFDLLSSSPCGDADGLEDLRTLLARGSLSWRRQPADALRLAQSRSTTMRVPSLGLTLIAVPFVLQTARAAGEQGAVAISVPGKRGLGSPPTRGAVSGLLGNRAMPIWVPFCPLSCQSCGLGLSCGGWV